jgi:flagellar basal body-associated protein FliL
LAQRQQQAENKQKDKERKAKTTKIVLITVGSLVAIALIVGVVYALKKRNKR